MGAIIQSEERHRLLSAVFEDQADGVIVLDSDGQGVLDGVGQLTKGCRFENQRKKEAMR